MEAQSSHMHNQSLNNRSISCFRNVHLAYKKPSGDVSNHQSSGCHREAVERAITLPKVTKDIGELLSEAHSKKSETITSVC